MAIDLGSLGNVIACALRPIIYLICQESLRTEVRETLKDLLVPGHMGSRDKFRSNSLATGFTEMDGTVASVTDFFG